MSEILFLERYGETNGLVCPSGRESEDKEQSLWISSETKSS